MRAESQFRQPSLFFDPMYGPTYGPTYGRSAAIYDLLYTGLGLHDYMVESAQLHHLIQDAVPSARSLLDVACGTGAHLQELRRWYAVEGLDASTEMLAVAQQRLPGVALHLGDMRTFDLGRRFDAVTCLFSSIGYLTELGALHAAIRRMADHVARPGVLILDGWVRPDEWRSHGQPQPEVAGDADTTVVRLAVSRRSGNDTDLEMHHLVRSGTEVEYYVENHRLLLVPTDLYVTAMQDAGLATRVLPDFMPGRDRVLGLAGA